MKKIVMTLVAAFVAVSMNAQDVWVGGSLGFTNSHSQGNTYNTSDVTVKPEIGFKFDENMDFALALGYTRHVSESAAIASQNAFSITPYVRYAFLKAGNFSAFVDGGLDYTTIHTNGQKNNVNQFGVFVTPGIAYAVSNKVTLVSHLGSGLYYNHQYRKDFDGDADYPAQAGIHRNNFGFELFNGVTFGAYVSF
jgi:hypothetical protein